MISAPPVPQHCIFISPWYVGLFFSFVKLGICRRDSCTLYLRQNFIMTWVSSVKMVWQSCNVRYQRHLYNPETAEFYKNPPPRSGSTYSFKSYWRKCVFHPPPLHSAVRSVERFISPFFVRMEGVQGKIVLYKFLTYRDVQNIEKSHLQHFLLP